MGMDYERELVVWYWLYAVRRPGQCDGKTIPMILGQAFDGPVAQMGSLEGR